MTERPGSAALAERPVRSGVLGKLRSWLLPGAAERDPGFRAEIERLNVRALLIIAAVCVIMPSMAEAVTEPE